MSGSAQRRPRAATAAPLRALLLLCLCCVGLAAHPEAAFALKAIEVGDAERVEITALGEAYDGRGDTLQIETAPGGDGIGGRMSVRAATPGTNPSWFVFALTNTTDKGIERWLAAAVPERTLQQFGATLARLRAAAPSVLLEDSA